MAASIMACIAVPGGITAQTAATVAPGDSIPSFDQLAREILVLRLQAEAMRGSVTATLRGQPDGGAMTVGTSAWKDSVRAAQANIGMVEDAVLRLDAAFHAARHRRGVRLIAELTPLLAKARRALEQLSRADDARVARIAITHLAAGLEALLQTIDEGKRCCQMAAQH